jgi:NAD kinase
VEQWLIDKMIEALKANPDLGINLEQLNLFSNKDEVTKKKLSYMITLGGDGTILYGAKQFTGPTIPFVVSFAMVSRF